jgi:hypothetical protein
MPTLCDPLVIFIKLKAKYKIFMEAMLFYSLQKYDLKKSCIFSKINYQTEFKDSTVSDAITSEVCTAIMVLLSLAEKYKGQMHFNGIMFIPGHMKICHLIRKLLLDRHMDMMIP